MTDGAPLGRYRVNDPSVIHQAIDGELVIIHLDRGVYYSLGPPGALMWSELVAGQPVADVAATVAREVGADLAQVSRSVNELVQQLCAEDLLVPIDHVGANASGAPSQRGHVDESQSTLRHFERPVLQRYDDLQDLLLLDPIHAVDESGWPERRDGG